MDDSLEFPNALPLGNLPAQDDDQLSSDEDGDDGTLDWTKLLPGSARPVIPRRGEKEFEPRGNGGTNLQIHVLDRARSAMFDTLRATRSTSSKAISYGIWHPDLARTQITLARGIHFSNMGHSAPRASIGGEGVEKIQKRLELLPEEAIYLVERGSLFCWKEINVQLGQRPGLDDIAGSPMSVQQAYAEMIGMEELSLEKFQVYAYLRRLGYIVTRTKPPTPYYPVPPSLIVCEQSRSIIQRLKPLFPLWMSSIFRVLTGGSNWWKPLCLSGWFHHNRNYASLFRSLRFLPAGHSVPLHTTTKPSRPSITPYQIFYNLYKPSTPFKKSAPPSPDFQIVVVNARTTPMPTLQELTDLFDVLPEMPLPPPRQRRPSPVAPKKPLPAPAPPPIGIPATPVSSKQSIFRRLFPWLFPALMLKPGSTYHPNPFVALKAGKKTIVIAVVDAGSISFFRFGQGEFSEWPMM